MMRTVTREFSRLAKPQLGAALSLLASPVSIYAQVSGANGEQQATAAIRLFKAHIPDSVLFDLKRRLAATKWPDQLPGTTWEYGGNIKKVRELADYWQTQYNGRAQEARIKVEHALGSSCFDSRNL